ncbi:histidine phosphatase family protein [Streptomyces sp. NPDC102437]|uniref:histidine phosphatase family protein n=1 Tax=Streptomyces sp. NPDC102437 TaxID=3366175 RepID=UPI00380A2A85
MTDAGEAAAKSLAPRLARRHLVAVFSSPLSRAMRTAELAGLTGVQPDPDLMEWDYGGYEGLSAAQIQETTPGWDLWRDGVIPGDAAHPGEELQQVAARTDAVLERVRPLLDEGDVAVVAHGHHAMPGGEAPACRGCGGGGRRHCCWGVGSGGSTDGRVARSASGWNAGPLGP